MSEQFSEKEIIARLRSILLPNEPMIADEQLIYEALIWQRERNEDRFHSEQCIFGRCTGTAENLAAERQRASSASEEIQRLRELLEITCQSLIEVSPRSQIIKIVRRHLDSGLVTA